MIWSVVQPVFAFHCTVWKKCRLRLNLKEPMTRPFLGFLGLGQRFSHQLAVSLLHNSLLITSRVAWCLLVQPTMASILLTQDSEFVTQLWSVEALFHVFAGHSWICMTTQSTAIQRNHHTPAATIMAATNTTQFPQVPDVVSRRTQLCRAHKLADVQNAISGVLAHPEVWCT